MENNKKIICFDINGTLMDGSSWAMFEDSIETRNELKSLVKNYSAKQFTLEGLWDAMVGIFRKTGHANKDFIHNFWKDNLDLKPGARELMEYLKNKGYKIYLISCSVDVCAEAIANGLGLQGFFTGSHLIFDDSDELMKIDSECKRDNHFKRDKLTELSQAEGVDFKDMVFVGDDENDIEVFKMTGHGIAMDSTNRELLNNSWKRVKSLTEIMEIL